MTEGDGRIITWSPYNKPTRIEKDGNVTEFVYGANRNRIRQENSEKTIYYVSGLFELEEKLNGERTAVHYIKAGDSTIAIVKSFEAPNSGLETRYLHRDHLNGIEAITDEDGFMVRQLSYDPHGKRRNTDWTDAQAPIPSIDYDVTQRGFTGHEHLDVVGLIHMNGRVYDPTLGRFLSADPFVQAPDNMQSLNRYSYVLNNPLSMTDPSGFFFKFLKNLFKNKVFRFVASIALAFVTYGAVNGFVINSAIVAAAGGPIAVSAVTAAGAVAGGIAAGFVGGFVGSGGNLSAALQGAVVGGLSGFIGASGAFATRTAKAVAHGVVGGAQAAVNGGKFLRGFASSFFTKQVSGRISGTFNDNKVGGAIAAATVGGTISVIGGGKFANGAVSSAFAHLFSGGGVRQQQASNTGGGVLDVVGKIWNLPNTLIGLVYGGVGHVAGWVMGTNPYITFGNNAIQFHNNPLMTSAMTLGNVIVYGPRTSPGDSNVHFMNTPIGHTVGQEEFRHTQQGQILGPLYFPAHILGGVSSFLRSPNPGLRHPVDPWHSNNFMETGPMQDRIF